MSHHVIIATVGCSGSTLLMAMLTKLGMDTGFKFAGPNTYISDVPIFGGGYEIKLQGSKAASRVERKGFPYVLKGSDICNSLLERIDKWGLEVDHVYGLFREPFSAAIIDRSKRSSSEEDWKGHINRPGDEATLGRGTERVERKFLRLCLQIAKSDIPYTMLVYPHYATDSRATYKKLEFLMTKYKITFERFKEVFDELVSNKAIALAKEYL